MRIFLNCPQCGSEVNMEEDASAFRCEYCTSNLKPVGRKEVQSFFISPNSAKETVGAALVNVLNRRIGRFRLKQAWLSYAPYWRVQGLLFQWRFGRRLKEAEGYKQYDDFKALRAINYDRSFPAFNYSKWEVTSLGLKTQFLKMRPYSRDQMGAGALLFGLEISHPQAVDIANRVPLSDMTLGNTREEIEVIKDGIIGEIFSLVYFPFYIFSMVQANKETPMIVDAVSHKLVQGQVPIEQLIREAKSGKIPYKPIRFIPLVCPHCNWDLPYEPDNRIHMCTTCGKAWASIKDRFQEVAYKLGLHAGTVRKDAHHLPFWKLEVVIITNKKEYGNLKEFYTLFRSYRVAEQTDLSTRKICFFIPAFRTPNVHAMNKAAVRMTRSQPVFEEMEPNPDIPFENADVCISQAAAIEMSHLLIYSMAPKGVSEILKTLESAQLEVKNTELIWLPFKEEGRFLIEPNTLLTIEKESNL